jgi:hypothetical protein
MKEINYAANATNDKNGLVNDWKELYKAVGEGEQIEWSDRGAYDYYPYLPDKTPITLGSGCFNWRIVPKTVTRSITYPKPESASPLHGTVYYYPVPLLSKCVEQSYWGNDSDDFDLLRKGFVHLTRENATLHSKALLGQ